MSYIVLLAEEIRSSAEAEARSAEPIQLSHFSSREIYLWLQTWLTDMWRYYT